MPISFWIMMSLASLGLFYFATMSTAIPNASHTQLEAALRRRGRDERLDLFNRYKEDLAAAAAAWTAIITVVGILAIQRAVRVAADAPPWEAPLLTFVLALGWVLLFGVMLGRGMARYRGEALIAATFGVLLLFRVLSWPLVGLARGGAEFVRRLADLPPPDADVRGEEIEREILDIVTQAHTTGAVDATEKRMIRSVMDLGERTVGQIMTQRTEIVALDVNAKLPEVRAVALSGGHSRLPVFESTIDNVLGVLYVKDLLTVSEGDAFSLRALMRSVPFVPETKILPELLREFQSNRVHVAIVLDEYGGTAGLVTFEDILEELVGDIADEHEAPEPVSLHRIDDATAEVDARVRVDELNTALNITLPEDELYDTVAGFMLYRIGRIPASGESLTHDGIRLQVLDADDRRIRRIRVLLPTEDDEV